MPMIMNEWIIMNNDNEDDENVDHPGIVKEAEMVVEVESETTEVTARQFTHLVNQKNW